MAIWESFFTFCVLIQFAIANFDHCEAKGLCFFVFFAPNSSKKKRKQNTNFLNLILILLEARAEIRKHFCWGFLEYKVCPEKK